MKNQRTDSRVDIPGTEEFVRLFVRNQRRVHAFILTLLPIANDAEEVLQETSIVAWQKFGSFAHDTESINDDFVRWACTIARYQVLAFWKKGMRARLEFSQDLIEDLAQRAMTDESQDGARRVALTACLRKLPPEEAGLFRRFYGENMTASQLAGDLGRTARAIYRMLQTIRSTLLECVRRELVDE